MSAKRISAYILMPIYLVGIAYNFPVLFAKQQSFEKRALLLAAVLIVLPGAFHIMLQQWRTDIKNHRKQTAMPVQNRLCLLLDAMGAVNGDIQEDYERVCEEQGWSSAAIWFCSQWITSVIPSLFRSALKAARAGRSVQK